jgi:hypothetical protein
VEIIISCCGAIMLSAQQHALLLEKFPTYEHTLRKKRPNASPHAAVNSMTRTANEASHKFISTISSTLQNYMVTYT